MQINLTGFLNGKNARQFMDELWALLLSAQESDTGIPYEFIQQKKDEIIKREEDSKLLDQMKNNIEAELMLNSTRDKNARSRSKESYDNGRSLNHRQLSPSPSKAVWKQTFEVANLPEKTEENGLKGKRSRSPDKNKDNSGKLSTSRQRSRDRGRSIEKSKARQKSAERSRQTKRHSRSRSRHRSRNKSTRKDGDREKDRQSSKSRSLKKTDENEDRKNDVQAALSKIQAKLLNMAEGSKKANRSPSVHSRSDKSTSRSRSK